MLIAFDIGTSATKATLHDDDGTIRAASSASYPTAYLPGARVEQNPDDWYTAVVSASQQLLAKTATPPAAIKGLCVSGQMMGLVCLDRSGTVIRPALIWSDQRAAAQAAALTEALGDEHSYEVTGHRLAATYTLPKLMWVRDHEPENFSKISRICVAKDYVNARLTGEVATDHSDASSSGAYDIKNKTWSNEVLAAAGISNDVFPPIHSSIDTLGVLRRDAAAELGLQPGIPVIVGGGDGPIASIGAGCTASDDPPYLSLGTSAWVAATTHDVLSDPQRRGFTFAAITPDHYCPCATTQNAGSTLEWIARLVGSDTPTLISEALSLTDPDPDLIMVPYLLGERSPWWDADARGATIGLTPRHTRADITRAALLGISFTLALCLEAVAPEDTSPRSLDAVGGGAQSDGWLQLLADIVQLPINRRNVTTNATSLGAGITGLVGLGQLSFSDDRSASRITATFEPQTRQYRDELQRFTEVYRTVKKIDDLPRFGKELARS